MWREASEELRSQVVENYADLVHESYRLSRDSATVMDEAVDSFIADSTVTLAAG